nr:hypothetical protein Y47D3A.20 - Caenorhabditis elegans [Caenorhabditis elegans]
MNKICIFSHFLSRFSRTLSLSRTTSSLIQFPRLFKGFSSIFHFPPLNKPKMQSPRASASPEPRRNETDDQREFKAISTNTESISIFRLQFILYNFQKFKKKVRKKVRGGLAIGSAPFLTENEMHEYRMSKLRESLKDARKTNWIHVGNAFRDPLPPHSSKP